MHAGQFTIAYLQLGSYCSVPSVSSVTSEPLSDQPGMMQSNDGHSVY